MTYGRMGDMDPIEALSEIAYWKERGREETRRVEAYRKAAWALEPLCPRVSSTPDRGQVPAGGCRASARRRRRS